MHPQSQAPNLSNNPFIDDPSNPHTRYPDISSTIPQSPQYYNSANSWMQSPPGNTNYYAQMLQSSGVTNAPQPGQPFQPSSGFGQQLMTQANPTGYSQIQPQPTGYPGSPYQNTFKSGYAGQQQMLYGSPGYQAQQLQYSPAGMQSGGYGLSQMQTGYQDVAQFDPYGPVAQGWADGQTQTQSPASPTSTNFSSSNLGSYNGYFHPRDHIRQHKAELELWDSYAWKQALNTFNVLKDAWGARKKDVEGRIAQVQRDYGYTGQQEVERLQGVQKQAELNFDSVAASSYQMHEVFQGYRQSADTASKRRVREALNAALSNLPEWPAQNY